MMTNLRLGLAAALTVSILGFGNGCSSHDDSAAAAYDTGSSGSADPYRPSDDGSAASSTPGASTNNGVAATDGGAADGSTAPDSGTGTGTGGGGGGAACLDDSAPAAQPACPANGECQFACDSFASDYKKGLSADIRACLTADLCSSDTSSCSNKALGKACADPTATTFCTPMVNGCKAANAADSITQASCESLAKGLSVTGRASLQGCFETDTDCGGCLAKML